MFSSHEATLHTVVAYNFRVVYNLCQHRTGVRGGKRAVCNPKEPRKDTPLQTLQRLDVWPVIRPDCWSMNINKLGLSQLLKAGSVEAISYAQR